MDVSTSTNNCTTRPREETATARVTDAMEQPKTNGAATEARAKDADAVKTPVDASTQRASRTCAIAKESLARTRAPCASPATATALRRALQREDASALRSPSSCRPAPPSCPSPSPAPSPQPRVPPPPAPAPKKPPTSPEPSNVPPDATKAERILKRGDKGEDVRAMQKKLNEAGAKPKLDEDGKFGPKTLSALSTFQKDKGLKVDGSAGPLTMKALDDASKARTKPTDPTKPVDVDGKNPGDKPANNTATIDKTDKTGAKQQVTGRITVNGRTYEFTSGGHGRGSLPAGEYTVSNLRERNTPGMVKDGVGFSADLSDKYDPRVGGTRTALRIHPDGGSAGTMGCIGIKGDAATLRRFYADLKAELAKNGGKFTLRVG